MDGIAESSGRKRIRPITPAFTPALLRTAATGIGEAA